MAVIRGVLFDFGGVVVPSPFESFARFETSTGIPAGTLRAVNSRNPDGNAWARLERGSITEDEFAAAFAAEAAEIGAQVDGHAVLALLDVPMERAAAHPGMLDLIGRLRAAGLRVAVLTNNVRPLRRSGADWVYDEVDAVVESCLAGVRKPEPAVYELAAERLDLPPGRLAFLDDLGINLKPARALGMATVKVVDPAEAVRELEQLCGI